MRRILHRSVLAVTTFAAAGLLGACGIEQVVETENIPTAGVRFVNAVPDTNAMDMRFVDIVESNAHYGQNFRSNPVTSAGVTTSQLVQYKNTRAGSRRFRVFLNDTIQSVASTVLKDTTYTFDANKLYTVMMWGAARTGGMRTAIWEDAPADPGSNVALRVINTTSSAIDARYYVSGGTAPATASWANIPPMSASSYINVPPGQYRINVQPAGGGTPLFADGLALIGAQKSASGDIEALPGTSVAGSAVSAIVFPRSTAGSRAPQTAAFTNPQMTFVWDKRPPR